MTGREAAIRETSRCDECAAPWTHEVNGRRLCGYDAANVLLAELAAARRARSDAVVVAARAKQRADDLAEQNRLLWEALLTIREKATNPLPESERLDDIFDIARDALDAAGDNEQQTTEGGTS